MQEKTTDEQAKQNMYFVASEIYSELQEISSRFSLYTADSGTHYIAGLTRAENVFRISDHPTGIVRNHSIYEISTSEFATKTIDTCWSVVDINCIVNWVKTHIVTELREIEQDIEEYFEREGEDPLTILDLNKSYKYAGGL